MANHPADPRIRRIRHLPGADALGRSVDGVDILAQHRPVCRGSDPLHGDLRLTGEQPQHFAFKLAIAERVPAEMNQIDGIRARRRARLGLRQCLHHHRCLSC